MPSGNGAKAAQKRERNLKRDAGATAAKSQLKTNEAAKSVQCKVCKQAFLCTVKEPELKTHQENKHPKNVYSDCF
eukprot:TRINITY_DN3792_c0_g1_i3.p2 TRINITY_DN3792_c0_g1~~TRINITY_DN3792_c0_g1_i3.p2  ORF type:complete len:75 (-),score=24.48 TRINITY_DN3792_c0_g1_i3:71-295(-)